MSTTLHDQQADDRALVSFLRNRIGEDAADPGTPRQGAAVALYRGWIYMFERLAQDDVWGDQTTIGIRLQEDYTTLRFVLWGVASLYADGPGYRSHWRAEA